MFELQAVTYSIAVGASGEPALWRSEDGVNVELIEGIEQMQILYGIDTDNDGFANQYLVSTAVADIGDPAAIPLPVDLSLSADDNTMWITTFLEGKVRLFDVSDPFHPKQTYEKTIGKQVNMVSQSWDGKRVYFTSSLLANWDKKGDDNEQFIKAYNWDGDELTEEFAIDFTEEKLGRPHLIRFGAYALYGKTEAGSPAP